MQTPLIAVASGDRMERALHARILLSKKTTEKTKIWVRKNKKQLKNILKTHRKI